MPDLLCSQDARINSIGDTLTFYAMVAQEGYVSRDGVLNGENSNDFPHRHLS